MADFEVTGVVDPARYSARAIAVFEIDVATFNAMSDAEFDWAHQRLKDQLGMNVLILVGARLARIEQPGVTDEDMATGDP